MNIKNIIYVVGVILLLFIASYLFTRKGVKSGDIRPSAPIIKQNIQQPAPETKKATTGIKAIFVELGSVNCTPCIMMAKIMDDIENEYDGQVLVRFYDVNSLLGRPYAQKYGIKIIPTQVFLDKEWNEYYRHEGFFPKEEVVKVLKMKGAI